MIADDRYLSLKQLSEYSSISESKLRALLREIPHARIGRKILVKRSDFDLWVRERRHEHQRMSPFVRKMMDKIMGAA
jgi:excisionase family DNA binding protein